MLFAAESALGTLVVARAKDADIGGLARTGLGRLLPKDARGRDNRLRDFRSLIVGRSELGSFKLDGRRDVHAGPVARGVLYLRGSPLDLGLEIGIGRAETLGGHDRRAMSAEAVMTRASWVPTTLSRLGLSLAARVSSCSSRS